MGHGGKAGEQDQEVMGGRGRVGAGWKAVSRRNGAMGDCRRNDGSCRFRRAGLQRWLLLGIVDQVLLAAGAYRPDDFAVLVVWGVAAPLVAEGVDEQESPPGFGV